MFQRPVHILTSPLTFTGRYYIKLGLYHAIEKPYTSKDDVKRWYVNGNPELAEKTKKLLLSLFKGKYIVIM